MGPERARRLTFSSGARNLCQPRSTFTLPFLKELFEYAFNKSVSLQDHSPAGFGNHMVLQQQNLCVKVIQRCTSARLIIVKDHLVTITTHQHAVSLWPIPDRTV